MKKLRLIAPHLLISLLLVLMVITILDGYNPAMGFLNSTVSKLFYVALFVVGIYVAVSAVLKNDK